MEFQNKGYRVIVISSDINKLGVELPALEQEGQISIHRYKVNQYRGLKRFIMHWVNGVKLYKSILKDFSPEIVVCRHHLNTCMLLLAKYRNVQYLVPGVVSQQNNATNHGNIYGKSWRSWLRSAYHSFNCFLQKQAFLGAKKVLVFSKNMADQVTKQEPKLNSRLGTTKPGVDPTRFDVKTEEQKTKIRAQVNQETLRVVILGIGRLVKAKGFDLAIQAMENVADAELWLIGDGPESDTLHELATKLGLQEQIKFLGAQSSPEQFYGAANFFILPSRYEPFGQTLLEALASGLPIITFESNADIQTASSEILAKDNAIWAAQGNKESLHNAIVHAVKMEQHQHQTMAENNRLLATEKFSWRQLANDLEANA